MSGIDRLRAIAGAWDEWGLGGTLADIADEIERERAEDCYRMGLDYGTVWRVVADMERHCLGHEGMEDSPVARWARELREALVTTASRQESDDVAVSRDALTDEDREAAEWVRERGGIDYVKVVEVSRDTVRCEYAWTDGKVYRPCCSPDTLTHAKPESIDTWQRIEEDAGCTATKYNERRGTIFTTKQQVAHDLVRRCRALAERERGE